MENFMKTLSDFDRDKLCSTINQDKKMEASSERSFNKESNKEKMKQAREALDACMKRDRKTCFALKGLLGPSVEDLEGHVKEEVSKDFVVGQSTDQELPATVVRVDKEMLQKAGGRVISISDTSGSTPKDAIILTQELSLLKKDGIESTTLKHEHDHHDKEIAKKENHNASNSTGLVKAFIRNVQNCTITIECKIISGTIEVSRCSNVMICIQREATVPTLQLDLCENVTIEFKDALSNKNNEILGFSPPVKKNGKQQARSYWGEDPADRIYHAGVKNMMVRIWRDGLLEKEHKVDFIKDGAMRIGSASKEEFQFITSVVNDRFVTEKVVKAEKGLILRPMTQRELDAAQMVSSKAIFEAMMTAGSAIRIMSKREFENSQQKM